MLILSEVELSLQRRRPYKQQVVKGHEKAIDGLMRVYRLDLPHPFIRILLQIFSPPHHQLHKLSRIRPYSDDILGQFLSLLPFQILQFLEREALTHKSVNRRFDLNRYSFVLIHEHEPFHDDLNKPLTTIDFFNPSMSSSLCLKAWLTLWKWLLFVSSRYISSAQVRDSCWESRRCVLHMKQLAQNSGMDFIRQTLPKSCRMAWGIRLRAALLLSYRSLEAYYHCLVMDSSTTNSFFFLLAICGNISYNKQMYYHKGQKPIPVKNTSKNPSLSPPFSFLAVTDLIDAIYVCILPPQQLFPIQLMYQRHYSPDEITAINHSLEKTDNKKLREVGSTSELLSAKATISFKDETQSVGHYYYKKRDEIGSGYTSNVYRCKNINNDSEYAIKVIELKKYSSSSLEMLDNEIEILKKVTHPNIIRFENVYKTATHCYLITEYCPHGDLLEYMTNNGKLCEKEAVVITGEIVEAVKYLFKLGVLHRDIKPANIFRSGKTWKIGDFGFSINSTTQTKTRHNVGTPLYMPLESLLRNIYSPESDIFAVGVILYEMMIGITPWQCKSEKELIRKMSTTPFSVPQKYKMSSGLKFLLGKMCAVNKEDRMSKEEFLELNLHNFNSLTNYSEFASTNKQPERKGRMFSVGKIVKQQPKSKGEYQVTRKKSKNDQKSVPKVEARSTSKNKVVDVKTYGNASRKSNSSASSQKKFQSKLQIKNCEVLTSQLNFCRFMYYMVQNNPYLSLSPLNRGRLCLLLFKHILKVAKQLSDGKNNWFGFTNWDSFRKSGRYQQLQKTLKQYCEKYQKQYLVFLKRAQINVIKEVNQKLPQFSTNDQFSIPFYRKILSFITPLLKECLQNLSNTKSEDGNARFEGLRAIYKYYRLVELSIKEYQNYGLFSSGSGISITKNYRSSEVNMAEYMQMRQEIKQL